MIRTALLLTVVLFPIFCDAKSTWQDVSFAAVLEQPFEAAIETHSYGPEPLQIAKFWPASGASGKATLVFVHGGCYLNTFSIEHSYALATALASQGFNVWSVEYRRSGDPGGGWPGSLEDVALAVRYIGAGIAVSKDKQPLYLLGHSAGGHLALLTAQRISQVERVFGLAAISDPARYAQGSNSCQAATHDFMGGTPLDIPLAYEMATVDLNRLANRVLLLHGSADNIVPLTQSSVQMGSYLTVNGAGHFDWIHPQTAAFRVLLSSLNQSLDNIQ